MAGFLDKMVVGITQGVNAVSEGSKLIVEKANINTQIQDAEKNKNNYFKNMGLLVYNLQKNGEINIEQCAGMCNEVDSLNQKINILREQLQALEMTKTAVPSEQIVNGVACSCGHINKEGSKYCAKCGQAIGENN